MAKNSFKNTPKIPYKILNCLIEDNTELGNEFWKALIYDEVDPLSQPNPTKRQRVKYIYDRTKAMNFNDYKIFIFPLITDTFDDNADENLIQLRFFTNNIMPIDKYNAIVDITFTIYTSSKLSVMRDKDNTLVERTDFIQSRLLDLLTNKDIGVGINFLQFDRQLDRSCYSTLNINNSKLFYGRTFNIALKYTDVSEDTCNEAH